jgi:hypothetical protein
MSYISCDDPEDDESYEDRCVPAPRAISETDRLTPTPPLHWFIACWLMPGVEDTREVGAWIVMTTEAQARSAGAIKRHMICRDARGTRVLVVDPALLEDVSVTAHDLDTIFRECNCGGLDCVVGEEQARASRTFARRKWAKMSLSERIEAASYADVDLDLALGDLNTSKPNHNGPYYRRSEVSELIDEVMRDY